MKLTITCETTESDCDFSAELELIRKQLAEGYTDGAEEYGSSSFRYHVVE